MATPELSILISTYQRPTHLYRCLLSIAAQERVGGSFEVIITDDGSIDETFALVEYFSSVANFPIKFTTHPHADFQLSRCRNEGISLASAPYILITDGDCVLPRDHLHWHMKFRRRGTVVAGDCYRLSQSQSERVNEELIYGGSLDALVDPAERKRIRWKAIRGYCYSKLGLKMLPRLTGSNIAGWKDDLKAINGFDENFVGWGLEDCDLQRRLTMYGIRAQSILHKTAAYHLWHPVAPSFSRNGLGTKNYDYYHKNSVVMRCSLGLEERIATTKNLLVHSTDQEFIDRQELKLPQMLAQFESPIARHCVSR